MTHRRTNNGSRWTCPKCSATILRSNRTRHVGSKSCAWVACLATAKSRGFVLFDKSGEVEYHFKRLGFQHLRESTGVSFFEKRVQTIWDALIMGADHLSPRGVVKALAQFDTREEFDAAWAMGWRGREYAAKRRVYPVTGPDGRVVK